MTHKFDPKDMYRLDDPKRKKTLPPEEVLCRLELKKGETFLDIGAGTGYFSFPASEMVGENGKVIAADNSDEMVRELSKRAAASGKRNITVLLSGEYDPGVQPCSIDLAFMSNVLHEVEDKPRMLSAIKTVLKENGRIGIVEWKKVSTLNGPPLSERIGEEEMKRLLSASGFHCILTAGVHDMYYVATASKS